jgi:hypothetical protein
MTLLTNVTDVAREIGSTTALADWRADEVYPGPRSVTLEDLRNFISAQQIAFTILSEHAASAKSSTTISM